MGSLLSKSLPPPAPDQKRILSNGNQASSPTAANGEPLFLDEVKVEPAAWSEESLCRTVQRFFGLLPDSPAQTLKKEQQYPMFRHRSATFVFNVGNRMGAILLIQQLYRRYRRMRSWHEVSEHMLQLARGRLAAQRAQEQDNISAASFRLLLAEGFSASKVCISGALKTIQLKLVLNTEAGECYLTWTPSRKKKPQINLHDIDQVIPVLKEGNPEAPRLSKKNLRPRESETFCFRDFIDY
ncbi:phosphoglycerate mutase family [Phytophthora cinnamomi]|uniref:phosphoglycerate mutase family n=1 Tax=Phytophthora cinnamomi TaxID=4785 RepID=UPI00355A32C8|nr:phosphoglycerate mutase family [Phytophthora cinnamomi]